MIAAVGDCVRSLERAHYRSERSSRALAGTGWLAISARFRPWRLAS